MEFVANFTLNNDSLDAEFDVSEVENFDALFEIYASGTTWGNISGDIENQTDLQNALSGLSGDIGDLQTTVTNNYNELSGNLGELETTVTNNYNELSGDIGDLSTTVTNNYNELNSSIDSNHQAISNINNTIQSYGDIVSYDAADFATSEQGALADTALQPNDNISELTNDVGYITSASLPVVNNNRITIQKNGSLVGDFTLNQSNDEAINLSIPTTAADVGALPDTTTINDLTTTAQQEALNSGANTTNIGQISANAQAIQTETNNRTNADNNLQSQIDAITAASDVTDIVGTYAELQAYDTTNLPNNSIIKVLQDESRDDETTYYRWVITGGVGAWVLIGEEGPYYTKSEADSTFVPQTRTINNKPLNQNINLTASDVGALPVGTQIGNGTILLTQGGVQKGTFTLNQIGNATIDFDAVSEDITIDTELSTTSENPVQNKVITGALNDKQDVLTAGTDLEIVPLLPSGHTQLKSITSTGSQYINTGTWLTDNFKAVITGRFTSTSGTQCVLGASSATQNVTYRNIILAKDSSKYYVYNGYPGSTPRQTNSSVAIDTNEHTFIVEISSGTTKISVDGVTNSENYTNINTDEDLFLFARNVIAVNASPSIADYAQFEMKSVRLYNDNALVFYGVPDKYGNRAGLYDTVSETFNPSLSATDFVAGEEISTQDIINFINESGYIKSASVNTLTDVILSNLTNGQGLIYNSTSQKWENQTIQGGGGTWGSITGTLSNQTDLQNALNAKADSSSIGNGTLYLMQHGSTLATFKANQSTDTTFTLEIDWGDIGGSIADQTDLQNALNAKSTVTLKDWTV